ncbi:unnamed protein product [Cylicostephanus goldi]|uniref:Decapping nuclease n=1 Tax=Cylicostephanus goldi TaxID=71465 RepID=A0A3P6RGK3_CYLGO|nr:unnamed protein product [Cylicostephanus goldi]
MPARAKHMYDQETVINGKKVIIDLNQGFDTFMKKEEDREKTAKYLELKVTGERLDNFWKWIIMQAPKGSSLKKVLYEADFVCCYGLMKRIGSTPFSSKNGWEFSAVYFDDVIFLCEEERYETWHTMSEEKARSSYYELKFKQYMTVEENSVSFLSLL